MHHYSPEDCKKHESVCASENIINFISDYVSTFCLVYNILFTKLKCH